MSLASKHFKNQSPVINNNDHMKIKNKNRKKNEINSQSNFNQSTNLASSQNNKKKINDNKSFIKNIINKPNNNRKINSYRQHEDKKSSRETNRRKNNSKSNMSNGKEKSKEKSKLFVKSANRTINSNNTNNFEIKLLSDRTFNKTKNRTLNKLSKLNISNIKSKHDKNKSKNHKLSHSGKRNKENGSLSKNITLKIFGKYMKENGNKNATISNGMTENGSIKINDTNNPPPIFKNIQKYHINKFKNKHYNILSVDKYKLKDNNINLEKINGQKENMRKINILNLKRAKSNFFIRKTAPNEFDMRLSSNKPRRSNDIFIYTKHYGDPNKCPLCQSMEMKAKFSENKLGIHKNYCKHDIEENKLNYNYSIVKTKVFPTIKGIEDKKDFNDITIKRILSPMYSNVNHNHFFKNVKEKFAYNILKNKGKIEKLGINDFPVLDNYFKS